MYTRCPSCRSEISFEPPVNLDSLPEGYKHRIKCPNCGVTIGVKLPKQDSYLEPQSTYRPANPNATSFEPIMHADGGIANSIAVSNGKPAKKSGRVRNALIFTFSFLFVLISVLGYLVQKGIIPGFDTIPFLARLASLNGISGWESLIKDFEIFKFIFAIDLKIGLAMIIPMVLFVLATINSIVSIACFIAKKFCRTYNLFMSLILGALAMLVLFTPFALGGMPLSFFIEYFMIDIIEEESYFLLIQALLGVLMVVFSLFFLAPMRKKQK